MNVQNLMFYNKKFNENNCYSLLHGIHRMCFKYRPGKPSTLRMKRVPTTSPKTQNGLLMLCRLGDQVEFYLTFC